jgi:hypothetical protein
VRFHEGRYIVTGRGGTLVLPPDPLHQSVDGIAIAQGADGAGWLIVRVEFGQFWIFRRSPGLTEMALEEPVKVFDAPEQMEAYLRKAGVGVVPPFVDAMDYVHGK